MLTRGFNGTRYGLRLRDEMDHLFSKFFDDFGSAAPFGLSTAPTYPALNIWDEGEAFTAEAEVPGLQMENIEVLVCNDELTVKGERPESATEGMTYHRRERGTGKFSRVVRLPVAVDAEKVEAGLKNGVLTIKLPKAQELLPRKVTVKG